MTNLLSFDEIREKAALFASGATFDAEPVNQPKIQQRAVNERNGYRSNVDLKTSVTKDQSNSVSRSVSVLPTHIGRKSDSDFNDRDNSPFKEPPSPIRGVYHNQFVIPHSRSQSQVGSRSNKPFLFPSESTVGKGPRKTFVSPSRTYGGTANVQNRSILPLDQIEEKPAKEPKFKIGETKASKLKALMGKKEREKIEQKTPVYSYAPVDKQYPRQIPQTPTKDSVNSSTLKLVNMQSSGSGDSHPAPFVRPRLADSVRSAKLLTEDQVRQKEQRLSEIKARRQMGSSTKFNLESFLDRDQQHEQHRNQSKQGKRTSFNPLASAMAAPMVSPKKYKPPVPNSKDLNIVTGSYQRQPLTSPRKVNKSSNQTKMTSKIPSSNFGGTGESQDVSLRWKEQKQPPKQLLASASVQSRQKTREVVSAFRASNDTFTATSLRGTSNNRRRPKVSQEGGDEFFGKLGDKMLFFTIIEFIPMDYKDMKAFLHLVKPSKSEKFDNYNNKQVLWSHYETRGSRPLVVYCGSAWKAPTFIPSQELISSMSTNAIANLFISKIEYTAWDLITCVTFVFSNGDKSPPDKTYSRKAQKFHAMPQDMSCAVFQFGLSWFCGNKQLQELSGLQVKNREGNIAVQFKGDDKSDDSLQLRLSSTEKIVSAQVTTDGQAKPVKIQFLIAEFF